MTPEEEKILNEMKSLGKPVRPGDIAKACEMESKEVSKAIASLRKQGLVDSPKRCYYAPVEK
ncbi:MAG: transcriptional regulator [Methanosarcinaceae archaeon]|nr:transcriptional regulator [Methanosarcinaceae archaeon]